MHDEKVLVLANVRIEQAKGCLKSSEILLREGSFRDAANRSYYCIFHAMRAVLALEKYDSKKHSGIIAVFRQNYVKTGIFKAELSDIIGDAFRIRNDSDYEDHFMITEAEVKEQIGNAKNFLLTIDKYIEQKTVENQ